MLSFQSRITLTSRCYSKSLGFLPRTPDLKLRARCSLTWSIFVD
jgi:hypothetical protein